MGDPKLHKAFERVYSFLGGPLGVAIHLSLAIILVGMFLEYPR